MTILFPPSIYNPNWLASTPSLRQERSFAFSCVRVHERSTRDLSSSARPLANLFLTCLQSSRGQTKARPAALTMRGLSWAGPQDEVCESVSQNCERMVWKRTSRHTEQFQMSDALLKQNTQLRCSLFFTYFIIHPFNNVFILDLFPVSCQLWKQGKGVRSHLLPHNGYQNKAFC